MHVWVCVDLFMCSFRSLFVSPGLLQSIRPNYRQNSSQSVVQKNDNEFNHVLNSEKLAKLKPSVSNHRPCSFKESQQRLQKWNDVKSTCNEPLPSVSWSLSKQCDRLSKCSESSFHFGIICRDGYLSGSSTSLECSERFLLLFANTVFQFQSLPCLNIMGNSFTRLYFTGIYLTVDTTELTWRNVDISSLNANFYCIASCCATSRRGPQPLSLLFFQASVEKATPFNDRSKILIVWHFIHFSSFPCAVGKQNTDTYKIKNKQINSKVIISSSCLRVKVQWRLSSTESCTIRSFSFIVIHRNS